jgi:polysaccharide biosynthesis protein PslH
MKLLVILPRFPFPTEKGDKLRAFNQLKVLSAHFDITLVALSHEKIKDDDLEKVKPYCSFVHVYRLRILPVIWNLIISVFNGWPLQAGYYYNKGAQRLIDKIASEIQPDHVYCQLLRTAAYAFNLAIPKTLDYQDVFSKGVERRIPSANTLMKVLFSFELKRLKKYEHFVFDKFDNKTIISAPDRDFIPHENRDEIVIIPNGVDQEYFKEFSTDHITDLVFTGNMGYPPNIDCAEYLVKKVLPLINKKYPKTTLTLAGASPHARVKALASKKVKVTGWVDDIRVYYAGARIFLAPMQLGTGLQNKLLEAMSMKLPCITSTLCNSALMAKEGSEVLIGNTPGEVAEHAIKLLEDQGFADSIAHNGYIFVKTNFSWHGATMNLVSLMRSTSVKISESL